MRADVDLKMLRDKFACLSRLLLKKLGEKRNDNARLSGRMAENGIDRGLRGLRGDLLRETGHLEEIPKDGFADWVNGRTEGNGEFRVKGACARSNDGAKAHELRCRRR